MNGNYKICMQNLANINIQFEFHLKTGIEAKDYEAVVTTKDLKPVELEAEKVSD